MVKILRNQENFTTPHNSTNKHIPQKLYIYRKQKGWLNLQENEKNFIPPIVPPDS